MSAGETYITDPPPPLTPTLPAVFDGLRKAGLSEE